MVDDEIEWQEVFRAELDEDIGSALASDSTVNARSEWGDFLRSELDGGSERPGQEEVVFGGPGGPSNPTRRKRGRPVGSTKLLSQSVPQPAADASQPSQSSNLELARAIRTRNAAESRQLANQVVTSFELGSSVQRTLGVVLPWFKRSAATSATGQKEKKEEGLEAALHHILHGDVLTSSSSAIAKTTGSSKTSVQRSLVCAGAAVLESAGLLFSTMWTSLQGIVEQTRGMRPLLCVCNMRYDETPTKVRVATLMEGTSGSGGRHLLVPKVASTGQNLQRFLASQDVGPKVMPQAATHAKVLQTQMEMGMLYQKTTDDGSKTHLWMTASIPASLQCMDRSTGEAQLSCLKETLATVPELHRLMEPFKLKVRISTTDRYGANTRAEEGLKPLFPHYVSVHLACDIHRLSTSIGCMLRPCQSDISGLLNTALALSDLGSVKKLRDALTEILFHEMKVVPNQPPTAETQEYRSQIYNMFLPTTGVLKSTEKLNRKRRFILSSMLNGYINTPNIQHFCPRGCCRNDAETFAYAALFLTWALVPFACPTLCRKSWIGQLATLNFVGVLEGHHNLFAKLMTKFFGKPVAPVQIVEEASSDPWLQALQDEVSRPGPHRVEEGRGPDDRVKRIQPQKAGTTAVTTVVK